MKADSFSFNGVRKSFIFCEENGREQSVFAPVTRNLLTFPGLPGALLESTDTKIRVIKQRVFYYELRGRELRKLEEELAAWLLTDQPVPLIFDDEPDRVYYAVVDGSFDIEESLEIGEGTITFFCADPYKYGSEQDPVEAIDGLAEIYNGGTAPSQPIIIAEVLQPITFINVLSDEAYMQLGEPADLNQPTFEPQTRLFWSQANTLVGWTAAPTITDGTVSGTLKTDGYWFYTDDYGTGTAWHGPAMKTSLTEAVQDFSFEVMLQQRATDPKQVGRVVVELLDESNNRVARLQMWRRSQYAKTNHALFSVHNATESQTIFHETGDTPYTWDDFFGMLRITRQGNEWRVYVAQVDKATYKHSARHGTMEPWVDGLGRFTAKVRQIVVHLSTFGTMPATAQRIEDIKTFRINDDSSLVPIIANIGDLIEMNFQTREYLINGEDVSHLKNFGANPFPLKPGMNHLYFFPPEAFDAKVHSRWRYK